MAGDCQQRDSPHSSYKASEAEAVLTLVIPYRYSSSRVVQVYEAGYVRRAAWEFHKKQW